jgi:F-type H+-transporting ATPase subunit a
MAANPETPKEYIQEHLKNWSYDFSSGEFGHGQEGFAVLHLDTWLFSAVLGFGFAFWLARAAAGMTAGIPSKGQLVIEMLFEFVRGQVKGVFPAASSFICALAFTIFTWILLMNTMDLVPVDMLAVMGVHAKMVPTTDPNLTFAMSLVTLVLMVYYGLRAKGVGGYFHEMIARPFGMKLLPVNLLLRLVEDFAKFLSLAMRLFGNLFAAEVIFLVIALLPFAASWAFTLEWVVGGPWAIYHILVVPLQAYLFMMLTVVYISLAYEHH